MEAPKSGSFIAAEVDEVAARKQSPYDAERSHGAASLLVVAKWSICLREDYGFDRLIGISMTVFKPRLLTLAERLKERTSKDKQNRRAI